MSDELPFMSGTATESTSVGEAVLTEAVKHVDIIHTSLAGMTAMMVLLTAAVSLPLVGLQPVTHPLPIIVICLTVFVGITVLYVMNIRVHKHVAGQASLTEVLVNSLGQGFLSFDRSGKCAAVYSQACLDLLETVPADKNISEVLHVPEAQLSDFRDWLDVLYMPNHALSFEDVANFLPQYYPHSQQRRIRLVYRPIRGKDGMLKQVVLIATDETEEYLAVQQAKQQQAFADMVSRIFKDRNQFHVTLTYLRDFIVAANKPGLTLTDAPPLLRQLHTLKAAVRHFGLLEMGDIVQQLESDLRGAGVATDKQFRQNLLDGRQKISTELDRIMSEFHELIGNENDWGSVVREIDETDLYSFAQKLQANPIGKALLPSYLSSIVAVPIQETLRVFERDLQDLVNAMNKRLKPVVYHGSNPRVLTLPMQDFLFSLTHVCRNIADHGIEAPSVRIAHDKDPAGLVTITADVVQDAEQGQILTISISDDGAGIDPARVREKLSIKDPEGAWRDEDDHQVIQHIFNWGFTTRDGVTELSGRGVGMDAVEYEAKKLGGSITVTSEFGSGTRFDIHLPYILDLGFMDQKQGNEAVYGAPKIEKVSGA